MTESIWDRTMKHLFCISCFYLLFIVYSLSAWFPRGSAFQQRERRLRQNRNIYKTIDDEVCICALVTHFNPTGSIRRLNNFHVFSERIREQGVYLVTVELYKDNPLLNPEEDSDMYTSIKLDEYTSKYPLWQKERLLNVGLELLDSPEAPVSCKNVAWIDGEILFKNDHWVEGTCRALESNYTVVQPYSRIVLPPKWESNRILRRARYSRKRLEYTLVTQEPFGFVDRGNLEKKYTGYAWVANRKKLTEVNYYDRGIVGGGDSFFLSALLNDYSLEDANTSIITSALKVPKLVDHYKKWATKVYTTFESRIGFPDFQDASPIVHLWHGSIKNRQYGKRWMILSENDYDPATDVVVDEAGFLTWSGETKLNATNKLALVASVKDYFEGRLEEEKGEKLLTKTRRRKRRRKRLSFNVLPSIMTKTSSKTKKSNKELS